MNVQFETAYNIFKDFYGEPKWSKDPNDGQRPDVIIKQWSDALAPYSVEQVRQACSWLTRKRRVMSFPMLDTLLAELSDKETESKKERSAQEEAMFCYNYILTTPTESGIMCSKLAARRAIYNIYGICLDGYDPNYKEEVYVNPTACRDELFRVEHGV